MHRALPKRAQIIYRIADRAGAAVGSLMRSGPGYGGALLTCIGVAQIYRPAGLIAGGVFLLLLDRRMGP